MTVNLQVVTLDTEHFASLFDGGQHWNVSGATPAQAVLAAWDALTVYESSNAMVRAELAEAGLHVQPWPSRLASSGTYCVIVPDGTDTNGDEWNRCTVHGELVLGDAYICEGYVAAPYRG